MKKERKMQTIITDTKSVRNITDAHGAKVLVLCRNSDAFDAEAVQSMLALGAKMTAIPDGASAAFAFGYIAAQSGKPDTITVLTDNQDILSAAAAFGLSTSIGKKPRAARKPRTSKSAAKETIPKGDHAPGDAKRTPVESVMPEPEPSETDVKSDGRLEAMLKKLGVDADARKVRSALQASSTDIVYDMQLRLHLLDAAKAEDVYSKTKNKFDELKKLV